MPDDNLARFAVACAGLLVVTAVLRFGTDVARCLVARALAAAFRSVATKERRR